MAHHSGASSGRFLGLIMQKSCILDWICNLNVPLDRFSNTQNDFVNYWELITTHFKTFWSLTYHSGALPGLFMGLVLPKTTFLDGFEILITLNRVSNMNKWLYELLRTHFSFWSIIAGLIMPKNCIFDWIWNLNDPKSVFYNSLQHI